MGRLTPSAAGERLVIEFNVQMYCVLQPGWGKDEIKLVDALAAQAAANRGHRIDGDPEEVTDEEGKTVRFWRLEDKA